MNNYQRIRKRELTLKRFGLTEADYEEMLLNQGGVCAICKGPPKGRWNTFCIDHNHSTGEIRGLLCDMCNRAIGMLGDNPERVKQAYDYLNGIR